MYIRTQRALAVGVSDEIDVRFARGQRKGNNGVWYCHAWNVVNINGTNLVVDCTLCDTNRNSFFLKRNSNKYVLENYNEYIFKDVVFY